MPNDEWRVALTERETRCSKSEIRKKPEIRMPKSFFRSFEKVRMVSRSNPLIRISGFGFLSDFGDSVFGFGAEAFTGPFALRLSFVIHHSSFVIRRWSFVICP